MNRKQSRADRKRNRSAAAPPVLPDLPAQAIRHHREGRLDEAEKLYRKILAAEPRHAESLHLLGHALWEQGRLAEAEAAFRRLLALDPALSETHTDLGSVLWEQARLDAAQSSYRNAIALKPDDAGAHAGLGNVLKDQADLDGAVACYRRALALQPALAEAHNNLGNALKELGRLDEAIACYRQALALRPDFVQAQNNLAVALWDQGKLEEAALILDRIAQTHPAYAMALNNLAALRHMQGDAAGAMDAIRRSLRLGETQKARSIFVDVIRAARWTEDNEPVRALMARALTEPWGRPGDLARVSVDLLKLDARLGPCVARAAAAWPGSLSAQELYGPGGPAPLADNPVLCALLESAQNVDLEMERFLTAARRLLLEAALAGENDGEALSFHAALARQCFINDYVFSQDEAEIRRLDELCRLLAQALEAGTYVPAFWLAAIAAYRPLDELPLAGRLLEQSWPQPVAALLAQQVSAPREEARLRADIPRLTAIADGVSQAVRAQYEENPYPRWTLAAPGEGLNGIGAYLYRKFPLASFQRRSAGAPDILIAGCGTGQQSIEAARRFRDTRILAVDLSLGSLAYARRKSLELGLDGIEHAQADILELGGLGRQFDLIEAVGVLHHMNDPFAGWGTLLSLLRPGGFMLVGLYSQAARRDILAAQDFIAARGCKPAPGQIRRCRQEIMSGEGGDFSALFKLPDFFGASTCRDLLFHVQERYVTLAGIEDYIRAQGLTLLGFEIARDVLHAYRRRFPDDPAATNLGQWQMFENENPETFSGMVQFWVQKPA